MNIDEKLCPYCGEVVKLVAIKCKHCNEFLHDRNAKKISYKLSYGEVLIKEPTDLDIKNSFLSFRNEKNIEGGWILTLERDDDYFMQAVSYETNDPEFFLQYSDDEIPDSFYLFNDGLTLDETLELFLLYLKEDKTWKTKISWIREKKEPEKNTKLSLFTKILYFLGILSVTFTLDNYFFDGKYISKPIKNQITELIKISK